MRRACAIVAGLALAIPTAVIVLLLTLVVAATGQGTDSPLLDCFAVLLGLPWSPDPEGVVRAVLRATAVMCCLPAIVSALAGEVAGLKSRLGYAGLTAALSLVFPLALVRDGGSGAISDPKFAMPLLVSGAVAGLTYAAVAVPSRRRSDLRSSRLSTSPGEP